MKTKIFIEWSPLYDNDIMTLARSNDDYLTSSNCVYMYTGAEERVVEDIPTPLYVDYMAGDIYYDNIKEKLIENLGRTEIQDINHQANWNMNISIGRVYTDGGVSIPDFMMKQVCDQLEKNRSEAISESEDYEFVHLTQNIASVQQRDVV